MTKPRERLYRPWHPITVRADNDTPLARLTALEINKADCVAIQAVWAGVASEEQQKRAMVALLHICDVNGADWMPAEHGGERDTAFAAGKRHVGLQLRKLLTFSLADLTGQKPNQ